MNKQTAAALIALLFSIGLIAGSALAAKNENVYTSVTTGKRMVVNFNIQQARKKAESDALGIAVQNAYSSLLPNQVLAENLEFFYDVILPMTKDFIITYKVLSGIETRGHYLVGVESKVDLRLLEKKLTDARILNANKNKPVILFFISEQTAMDLAPRVWWTGSGNDYYSLAEQRISDRMTREKFMVIGGGVHRPDPSFYNIRFQSVQDRAAAIDLGRQMKADVVVIGSAMAEEAINRMGEDRTFNAFIKLTGYNVVTSEQAVATDINAVATSQTNEEGNINALVKAAELAAEDLGQQLDSYWMDYMRKERSFEVRIEGDKFLARYLALTRRFKQMPGVENVQPKEMGSGHAVLEMFYKGSPSQFANTLLLKTFDDFGFELTEVTDDIVTIQLIEKVMDSVPPDAEEAGTGEGEKN